MEKFIAATSRFLSKFLRSWGLVVIREVNFQRFLSQAEKGRLYQILTFFPDFKSHSELLQVVEDSKSQLHQEILALVVSNLRHGGYFVEFGATNGVDLSNTLMLERKFGWKGILAEPGKQWHADLKVNRRSHISTKAVWSETGQELEFLEDRELSTLKNFAESDHHQRSGKTYTVETLSLTDLLQNFDAPQFIDFLSVDTEGSEYEVLSTFDFDSYSFGLICVEHNYTTARHKLHALLESKGYVRVLEHVSEWDDWYLPRKKAG